MVKILLDPSMYHPHLSVAQECQKAADLGYEYIELSPRADFHEWHHYPKVDDAEIAKVKKAMAATGVKIWTFNPVFNWSSPDEQERQAQVRNFRRLLEIAEELEVPLIATEFSGDPNEPLKSEHQFYKSIEELIPDFERRGIECTIEAHPYDFVEDERPGRAGGARGEQALAELRVLPAAPVPPLPGPGEPAGIDGVRRAAPEARPHSGCVESPGEHRQPVHHQPAWR